MLPLCCYMSYQVVMFSASKTLSLINYVFLNTSTNHDEFKDSLLYHDVKKKVAKIHRLLFDITDTHPSIHMAINDIKETIDNLNQIIEEYIAITNIHNYKYLKGLRSIDVTIPNKNLLLHVHLLDTRFNDFVKITQLLSYYSNKSFNTHN